MRAHIHRHTHTAGQSITTGYNGLGKKRLTECARPPDINTGLRIRVSSQVEKKERPPRRRPGRTSQCVNAGTG